jgi:hypothetical protein
LRLPQVTLEDCGKVGIPDGAEMLKSGDWKIGSITRFGL